MDAFRVAFELFVLIANVVLFVQATRDRAEVEEHAVRWGALARTQLAHDAAIRELRALSNPMSRRAQLPAPDHLQHLPPPQENHP